MSTEINYGPLTGLIGEWAGDKGIDVSPLPDDTERNPFYETLSVVAAGDVENAEKQTLTIVRYHQQVFRKSNDEQFHDQVGYITWDESTGVIAHSCVIPRGVALVAGGKATTSGDEVTIHLEAHADSVDWTISEAPFMRDNASTRSFVQTLVINGDQLSYEQRMGLGIYDREFDHVDKSKLVRK
ncbi:MAG: heme-binding beta-barrel domain-containing protein [Pseudomonadota bacterium]